MRSVRKIIGAFIIILLGLPTLFAIIWAVGLAKATIAPEFVSDLPREIISEVPDMADEIFKEAQDKNVITDENTRAWFRAAAEAGVTPKEFLEKIGILGWLEDELSQSLKEVGEILRGEIKPRIVVFDLRPLKKSLLSEDVDLYLLEILKNLPPCDEDGTRRWQQASLKTLGQHSLPACQPDLDVAKSVLEYKRIEAIDDIPDEFEIFEDVHFLPFGVSNTITLFSYFLFLIPAVFIFGGALIAATSPASFLRWSGIPVFIGGLPALSIAFFAKHISLFAIKFAPYSYSGSFSTELHDLILEKTSWIPMIIVDRLFSPVIAIAGIVCLVGFVLFVLSFTVRGSSRR
jgi:hypothetical protein